MVAVAVHGGPADVERVGRGPRCRRCPQRPDGAPCPEDFTTRIVEVDAANQQLSEALGAMLRLGEEDREVLELCGLFGFTPAQASITLGVPAGTVRVRLHRARQRLSEAIDGEVAS